MMLNSDWITTLAFFLAFITCALKSFFFFLFFTKKKRINSFLGKASLQSYQKQVSKHSSLLKTLLTILLFFNLDSSKLTNTSIVNAPTYCVFQVKSLLLWLSPMNLYRLRTKADAAFHTPIEANYCHRLVPSSDDSSVIDRPGSTHSKERQTSALV
ncbi:hypothetical protein EDC96DRAFT_126739 [Choanephora cucurbitarum]|nr:hypothetical protein EDC96DRAFT_126739 [Choanephora cucurbitarum]